MRAAFVASWFVSSLLLVACGSNGDAGSSSQDAAPSSDASPIVTDDGGSQDTSPSPPPADTGPSLCWIGRSSEAWLDDCMACSQAACADGWTATWGTDWSKNTWAGACQKDAACLCGCDESDLVCRQNCDITFEDDGCRTAKQALYDCETAKCSSQCGRSF